MTESQVRERIQHIVVWKRGGERAPHKPLLLLYALARISRDEPRLISYAVSYAPLKELLRRFGPVREVLHPEYPFQRLQNDGLWQIEWRNNAIVADEGVVDLTHSELIHQDASGGFQNDIYNLLIGNQKLTDELVSEILTTNFPESIHDDILEAIGMRSRTQIITRRVRNPEFRSRVLTTYEHRCAVCGFDVRLDGQPIAIEAAHIKWHQARGPDIESNGLALCAMHHRLFDRGALTVTMEYTIRISNETTGTTGLAEWLQAYDGCALRSPQQPEHRPDKQFLDWHQSQVFHGLML